MAQHGTEWHGMAWDGMGWHGRAQQGTHGTHGTEWHAWHRMTQVGTGWHTWHTAQDGTQSTGWHRVAHIAYSTGWHTWHTWHTTEAGRGWQRMAEDGTHGTQHSTAHRGRPQQPRTLPATHRRAPCRAERVQLLPNGAGGVPGGCRSSMDRLHDRSLSRAPSSAPSGPSKSNLGGAQRRHTAIWGGRRVSLPPRPPPGTPGAPTHMTAHCAKDR